MRIFRQKVAALALACACMSLTHGRLHAEERESSPPSDFETKCTDFLKKVTAAKRKTLDKRMADEIADVTKVTGVGPDGVKALEAAAVTAEDTAQAELLARALEVYLKAYARMGGRGLQQLDQPGVVETMARNDSGFDASLHYTRALDQPAWKDALAHSLSAEQAATWQKAQDARIGTVAKELDDMLDRQADQIRTTISSPMFTKSTEIIDSLNLPKDRADAVSGLARKAIEASMESWRKEARKQFLSSDDAARSRVARGMPFYSPPQDENSPENQVVWTQGIAKLLSSDDRAALQASHGLQRTRRTHALAMLMLTLMDDKVAFTSDQRPKLEPIMERLVQKVDELYSQADNNNDYSSLSPSIFYKASTGARAEELRPILDELQWKHWQAAGHEKGTPNEEDDDEAQPVATPAKASADTVEEPEDLEQFVSDYLADKAAVQHKAIDATMLLQAEDAARVAGLPPDTAARLRTAAHGAAETALASWSSSVEQNVRGQVQGATKETLQQRLGNNGRYYFGQSEPKDQAIWKQAVKSDLTQTQQDVWQVERDARAQYGDAAIAQFLLAEFDRSFILSTGQWERLTPLLTKTIHDYRPDIGRMFSYNTPQWFLTSYYIGLPLLAIPEDECKTILGKDRYDRWTESNGYRYSMQYWTNLKQYHDQRTGEEKK